MAFRVGDWEVEPSLNRISSRDASLRLEPKVMELLVLLAERGGAVVTKGEITERLWPGTHVTESSIFRHVSELRRALGDDRRNPRYLRTIPKRGYCLVATGPSKGPWRPVFRYATVVAASLLLVVILVFAFGRRESKPRLAVLPFRLLSAETAGEETLQAEAFRAMLRNRLVLLEGVDTIEARDREEARSLGASTTLEGVVESSTEDVVVSIRLVETDTGEPSWSQSYRGSFPAVASLESEMVAAIMEAVDADLSSREARRLGRRRPPVRPDAYQAYLRGELFENRVDCQSFDRAIALYSEAMGKDRGFMDVYPKLFDAFVASAVLGCRPPELLFAELDALLGAADRLGLDASRREQGRAALTLWRDGDAPGALDRFRAAQEIASPGDTDDLSLAIALLVAGRPEDGVREARRCLEDLPVDLGENWAFGGVLYLTGRYEEAIDQLLATLELYPDYRPALQLLALSYLVAGDAERAVSTAERAEPPEEDRWARFDAVPAYVYAVTGDELRARNLLTQWKARSEAGWVPKTSMALIHLGLGEVEQAERWLERARQERDPWVVLVDDDPAFRALSRRDAALRFP